MQQKLKKILKIASLSLLLLIILILIVPQTRVLAILQLSLWSNQISGKLDPGCFSATELANITPLESLTPIQQQILAGAKERTKHTVVYRSVYYSTNHGKPPDNEGVCTDVIWRALERANLDLASLIDTDIKQHPTTYPFQYYTVKTPDINIDYRRVPNLQVYFQSHAQVLTTDLVKCNIDNLKQWQPGDIVIFQTTNSDKPDHIAIISDTRNSNGIPFIIHNYGWGENEDDSLAAFGKIVGHYRL